MHRSDRKIREHVWCNSSVSCELHRQKRIADTRHKRLTDWMTNNYVMLHRALGMPEVLFRGTLFNKISLYPTFGFEFSRLVFQLGLVTSSAVE